VSSNPGIRNLLIRGPISVRRTHQRDNITKERFWVISIRPQTSEPIHYSLTTHSAVIEFLYELRNNATTLLSELNTDTDENLEPL
jgi:hypothetical protein